MNVSILKYIFPVFFILTILLNRGITQSFGYGPIFILEFGIVIGILLYPNIFLLKKLVFIWIVVFVFLFFASIHFFLSLHSSDSIFLSARRSAVAFYFLIPILIICYHRIITKTIQTYIYLILTIPLVAVILPGVQSTMVAQFYVALLLLIFTQQNNFTRWQKYIVYFGFLLSVSGFLSGGTVYRTPVVCLIFGALFHICHMLIYKGNRRLFDGFYKVDVLKCIFFLYSFLFVLVFTVPGRELLGGLFLGFSGIFDSSWFREFGYSLGSSTYGSRGSLDGTTQTRLIFWTAIIQHHFPSFLYSMFGFGTHLSFIEQTLPNFQFLDANLIEPHNSFMSIFFKYGFTGLVLSLCIIFSFLSNMKKLVNNVLFFPFLIQSVLFAGFEVALENPHGASMFWFILSSPYIFTNIKDASKRI